MPAINAHELVGSFQTVYWNEWVVGDKLEFEFIDYFIAPVFKEGNCLYQVYYAVCKKDYPHLGMRDGDDIILHLSYRALSKALNRLPIEMKIPCLKKSAEGKNLFIKIERVNPISIKVHYQEPREPSEEHKANADKYYKIINAEHQHGRK